MSDATRIVFASPLLVQRVDLVLRLLEPVDPRLDLFDDFVGSELPRNPELLEQFVTLRAPGATIAHHDPHGPPVGRNGMPSSAATEPGAAGEHGSGSSASAGAIRFQSTGACCCGRSTSSRHRSGAFIPGCA